MERKDIIIAIQILIMIFLGWLVISNNQAKNDSYNLIEALNSEVKVWKDKDSLNHAKIQSIETESTKDFLNIKSKDSAIIELQKSVKEFQKYLKEGGMVANVTNVTEIHNHSETIVSYDSLNNPIYKSSFNLEDWVKGDVTAEKDTTKINLSYKNKLTVVFGEEKVTFMRKHRFVEIKDHNPYSSNPDVKAYNVKLSKVKRFGVGPYIGYGVGTDLQPRVNVGIGVQFNLIRF